MTPDQLPLAYQLGVPIFFLAVAGASVLYIHLMSGRLEREERRQRDAHGARPAE